MNSVEPPPISTEIAFLSNFNKLAQAIPPSIASVFPSITFKLSFNLRLILLIKIFLFGASLTAEVAIARIFRTLKARITERKPSKAVIARSIAKS